MWVHDRTASVRRFYTDAVLTNTHKLCFGHVFLIKNENTGQGNACSNGMSMTVSKPSFMLAAILYTSVEKYSGVLCKLGIKN